MALRCHIVAVSADDETGHILHGHFAWISGPWAKNSGLRQVAEATQAVSIPINAPARVQAVVK